MKTLYIYLIFGLLISQSAFTANIVPSDVQLPGTQPLEIGNLESPNKCDNCHGGYNSAVEPAHNWRGSMMAQAGRDPIFWATMAIAEQDFDGVGDLCIRCHSTTGWFAGRSTPTDGSGLAAGDSDGVDCDFCHKLTNPDDSQHLGNIAGPFVPNDGSEAFYGSGISSMWGGSDKLGPYVDADARHQFMQSFFHRDRDFCGTCHDVSNSVTGDLAHNHGQSVIPDPVNASDKPGGAVDGKAAFNNPPYAYGIVERTFSEYKSGQISQTLVDEYPNLPELPRGGILEGIYLAATKGGTESANYQNPASPRYFSCQTCHMRPVTGMGANKRGVPKRTDLPLHDMTGGNYWMPSVIEYLDGLGKLRLGGGMSPDLVASMNDGALRAKEQLELAATLEVDESKNKVKVINHTGHKLITGYPEGRRMWLNIKWYDDQNQPLREDGKYGPISALINGVPVNVNSILNLNDPNTKIWEAHMGMTQKWAQQLIDLGYSDELPLSFNRLDGSVSSNLGQLASGTFGTEHETFHFAMNNIVIQDNRIPPYKMSYDIAKQRNALPVPADQFGGGLEGSFYQHYIEVDLNPPTNATRAEIRLMYQPTSWEYIQFLALANDGENAFLGEEGANMLDAWLNTGMAEPYVMTSASWGAPVQSCNAESPVITEAVADDKKVTVNWSVAPANENVVGHSIYYDQSGKTQVVADSTCLSGPCSYTDISLTNGQEYCYKLTARSGSCESDFSNIKCATPQPQGHQQEAGIEEPASGRWITEGKGKNATRTFVITTEFVQGDEILFQAKIVSDTGSPLSGATFDLGIAGPESTRIISTSSDSTGLAEATWNTQNPNKKGVGGTAVGSYVATISGLTASGYNWDGLVVQMSFTIDAK
jgi:hypothetical protein